MSFKNFEDTVKKDVEKVEKDLEGVFHRGEKDAKAAESVVPMVEKDIKTDLDQVKKDVEEEAPVVKQDIEYDAKVTVKDAEKEGKDVVSHPGNLGKDAKEFVAEEEAVVKPQAEQVAGQAETDEGQLLKNAQEQAKEIADQLKKDFAERQQSNIDAREEEVKPTGHPTESADAWANRFPSNQGPTGPIHQV